MNISKTTIRITLAGLVLAASATVGAVTTQSFVLDTADAFLEGELEGAAVHSDGSVRAGAATQRTALENVPLAYSVAQRGGKTFIGTGTNGVVYEFDGKHAKVFAETGELLVASLAFGRDGALYAGTLPNGRIYRIDTKSGKMKRFSSPKGAKHIWALHYDKRRGQLVAGTGPEGKVFTVDSIGRAREIYKAEASHIMALAGDGKGTIYAGTSDDALVLRIGPNNEAQVVHDFPGNEVTAIDYHDGRLAVAANEFKTTPGARFKPAVSGTAPAGRRAARPRPGSGELWRVDADGRAEMLVSRKDTHLTAVQWGTDGAIYAGSGHEGRILRVEPDASYSIWVDVEERQVLALDLRAKNPSFVTGDGAAIYRVQPGTRRGGTWTSKALDASFASKWGRLTWRGRGHIVLQTRSGNTQTPGGRPGAPGPRISSNPARSRALPDASFKCAPSSQRAIPPCFARSSYFIFRRINARVFRTYKAHGPRPSTGNRLANLCHPPPCSISIGRSPSPTQTRCVTASTIVKKDRLRGVKCSARTRISPMRNTLGTPGAFQTGTTSYALKRPTSYRTRTDSRSARVQSRSRSESTTTHPESSTSRCVGGECRGVS